jgi:hypothetical protein
MDLREARLALGVTGAATVAVVAVAVTSPAGEAATIEAPLGNSLMKAVLSMKRPGRCLASGLGLEAKLKPNGFDARVISRW